MTEETQSQGEGSQETTVASMPEGFPGDFWDAKTGTAKIEKLAAAYSDAKSQLDVMQSLKAEIPEKPEDYQIALPESFEMPEGVSFDIAKHSSYPELQKWAHQHGVPPSAMAELVSIEAGQLVKDEASRLKAMSDLGANSNTRIANLSVALRASHGPAADALSDLLPMAPEIVPVIEKLIAGGTAQPGTENLSHAKDQYYQTPPEHRLMGGYTGA